MRFTKLITLAVTAFALAATGATAAPAKRKPEGAAGCKGKAKVMVVLKGAFVAAAADALSFQLNADHANRHGRPYLKLAQPLTVNVDAKTRIKKSDQDAKLADLVANDRLVVKSKVSRCDLRAAKEGEAPALTARQVVVQPPAEADEAS
jgi:hypothetical protein